MTEPWTGARLKDISSRAVAALRPLIPQRFRRDRPVVPVVRLTGIIGFSTPLRPGLSLAGIARSLERAFAMRHAPAVALAINSPGGSPVQSHLIFRRIRELAQHFIKKYSEANGLPVRPLSAEASRALNINRWPGNVRELENTLHRAVLLSTGAEIGIDGILSPDGMRLDQSRGTGAAAQAAMAADQVTRNLVGRTVAEVERDLILETLKHCLGNRTHAANILGISIRTLRNKLNEYSADGVPVPSPGGGEVRGAA